MKLSEFLKIVSGPPTRLNYFVLAPDELGLNQLLARALEPETAAPDLYFHNAEGVTKEKARQIEAEARLGPRGGSALQTHFIYGLQRLQTESVGPLLKVVESATFARFIFQAQGTPRKLHTLMSRSAVVRLPFLSKDVVLANLKAMQLDARAADELNLWDGTLGGTTKALTMKDTITAIRREMAKGTRGLAGVFNKDLINSPALTPATDHLLSRQERLFLGQNPTPDKKKIVLFLAMSRMP